MARFILTRQGHGVMKLVTYLRGPLLKNTFFLTLNTGLTSLLGALFWFLAAKLYPADEVGLATTLVAAVTLLGVLTSLGIGMSLMVFLPSAGAQATSMINTALTAGAIISTLGGLVFLLGLPLWSPALIPVLFEPIRAVLFLCAMIGWMLFSLQDDVLTAYRATQVLVTRGLLASIARVALAAVFVGLDGFGLFSTIIITQAIAVGWAAFQVFPRIQPDYKPRPDWNREIFNMFRKPALAHYTADTLSWLPSTLFPILVANRLGMAYSAYLYVAIMLFGVINMVPARLATALLVEGAHDREGFRKKLSYSMALSLLIAFVAIIVVFLIGGWVLSLFGHDYSRYSRNLLLILSFASIPSSINGFYAVFERVNDNLTRLTVVTLVKVVLTLFVGFILLDSMGIDGIGIAILVGSSAVAIPSLLFVVKPKPRYR